MFTLACGSLGCSSASLLSALSAQMPGGGAVVRVIVECADTDQHLDKDFVAKLPPKFMGWRLVILKVPIGHVRVFYKS